MPCGIHRLRNVFGCQLSVKEGSDEHQVSLTDNRQWSEAERTENRLPFLWQPLLISAFFRDSTFEISLAIDSFGEIDLV